MEKHISNWLWFIFFFKAKYREQRRIVYLVYYFLLVSNKQEIFFVVIFLWEVERKVFMLVLTQKCSITITITAVANNKWSNTKQHNINLTALQQNNCIFYIAIFQWGIVIFFRAKSSTALSIIIDFSCGIQFGCPFFLIK